MLCISKLQGPAHSSSWPPAYRLPPLALFSPCPILTCVCMYVLRYTRHCCVCQAERWPLNTLRGQCSQFAAPPHDRHGNKACFSGDFLKKKMTSNAVGYPPTAVGCPSAAAGNPSTSLGCPSSAVQFCAYIMSWLLNPNLNPDLEQRPARKLEANNLQLNCGQKFRSSRQLRRGCVLSPISWNFEFSLHAGSEEVRDGQPAQLWPFCDC